MTSNAATLRALHVIDTGGPGGAETVYVSIASYCQQRSANVAALVPYEGWLACSLRSHGVEPVCLRSKGANPVRLAFQLAFLARKTGANLMVAHLLGSSVYAALVGLILKIPVVAIFHGETDLKGPGSFRAVKRWLLRRSHVTRVAVSDSVCESMVQWGICRDDIRIVRNGVDVGRFSAACAGSLHAILGIDRDAQVVGAVGNIREAKSYEVLVEAASHVRAVMPNVHFVVVGSGARSDLDKLELHVEQLCLGDRFHFLGFRETSASIYRSFRVFASSAKTEGLPLSFLEAMACEVPIAATANDGAACLIGETGGGLLSPVGDPSGLALSILTLLRDPDLARRVGRRGRASVCANFSVDSVLAGYYSLFEELLFSDEH